MPLQQTAVKANASPLDLDAVESIVCHAGAAGRLVWDQNFTPVAEKFSLLAHRLLRARRSKPIQVVLVTSAVPAEGKSTVAANLAGFLTRNGSHALLIDADLRKSDIHRKFGFDEIPGLGAVLNGELTLQQALRRLEPRGIYFLSAGAHIKNPVPLLEGEAFSALIDKVRESFEWIIIDSPPINRLVDAQCIANLADTTVLVVRWGFTPKEELNQAIATLGGLPLLGIVLNRFDDPQESYYYYYSSNTKHTQP